MEKKILITGPGKCGTTFLVQLLTYCGVDTGYTPETFQQSLDKTGAGGEWNISQKGLPTPYIIKNPGFCIHLSGTAAWHEWEVEHVYVCMRPYDQILAHQKDQAQYDANVLLLFTGIATHVGQLMEHLVFRDIPYTIVKFPNIVKDPKYCYEKILPLINIRYDEFLKIYNRVADLKKVHY